MEDEAKGVVVISVTLLEKAEHLTDKFDPSAQGTYKDLDKFANKHK